MTHYELTQCATRECEHGKGTVCGCSRKAPSANVQAYLDRAKSRLRSGVSYNPEWTPDYNKTEHFRFVENPTDGLRLVGKVHDIEDSPIDHRGWYTDPHHDVSRDGTGLCY